MGHQNRSSFQKLHIPTTTTKQTRKKIEALVQAKFKNRQEEPSFKTFEFFLNLQR